MADKNSNHALISVRRIVKNLLAAGKIEEASKYLASVFAQYSSGNIDTEIGFLDVMAYYWTFIGKFNIAERYIQQFLNYENERQ